MTSTIYILVYNSRHRNHGDPKMSRSIIKSIDVLSLSSAAITPMSDWYLNPKEYGILMDDDPKKKRYYNSWRSKYFMDNRHIREIKKSLVKSIYNALS